jgi:uncharacterized protein with GYD domain
MPKYLFHGSYTAQGAQGLLKEGGTARRQVAQELVESLGGMLEAYYFAFGADDFYLIADLPDNASAAAGSMVASASGALRVTTTVLLTPEEVDEATRKTVRYRPPGT